MRKTTLQMDLKSYMKEKITLHAVHCIISMLQSTNLDDKY